MNNSQKCPYPVAAAFILSATMAHGAVVVEVLGGGNGSTVDLNVAIDAGGSPSTLSPFFDVSGTVANSGIFGGTVGITFDGIKNVSSSGPSEGQKLSDGIIDNFSDGFGVLDAPNGGGIGNGGGNREGISFQVDELTGFSPTVGVQITSIDVANVGRAGDPVDESFTIVNPNTLDSLTFIPVSEGLTQGDFDVSSLNLIASAGSSNPVAAIYSGDVGGFRVNGLTFDAVAIPEPSSILLGGLGLLAFLRRRR
jgi:hypothetical protein